MGNPTKRQGEKRLGDEPSGYSRVPPQQSHPHSSSVSHRLSCNASRDRAPCFRLLRLDRAFPSCVFGPVDLSHGRQRWIAKACRLRLSVLQPFMSLQ